MGGVLILLLCAAFGASAADLELFEAVLRASEDGAPMSEPTFPAGVPVFLTFRIRGYSAVGEDRQVQLGYKIQTMDPAKRLLAHPVTGEIKVELAPEDKDWTPRVRYDVLLPPVPEPGVYTIDIAVEDKNVKAVAHASPKFRVEAPAVPDLESLGVRNFRFMHSEDDVTGYETGVYKPGATVWARFDVSGYKFGPGNEYDVRYGLALRNAEGKVLFEQPKAAAESDKSFYPKLFTSGTFSLNLDKNIKPGDYMLVVTVTDGRSSETIESAHLFRVES